MHHYLYASIAIKMWNWNQEMDINDKIIKKTFFFQNLNKNKK